ncbi:hypothetical protein [Thalassotalea sp. Y01]|uniref:hypothetical protein n=1 Tax=Thalassotalea sp. Y01 TaxID=2729613 RepID=UPI00145D9995|nr:hypothetical protein [Thalassotalea sp. Y01]NMP15983.1 hypothetical protein [Thalassotalea sp. Y01]
MHNFKDLGQSIRQLCIAGLLLISTNLYATEIGMGLQRYVPLNQDIEFDGLIFKAKYDVASQWQVFAEFEFLQEEIDDNDFTLSRQLWGVSYHFDWPTALTWTLSIGGHHQQLDFDGVEFDSEQSDSSFLGQINGEYAFTDSHYAGLRFRYYQIYDNDRYDVGLYYQYQMNHHWRLLLLTDLGYDSKFNHDVNRYNIELNYRF